MNAGLAICGVALPDGTRCSGCLQLSRREQWSEVHCLGCPQLSRWEQWSEVRCEVCGFEAYRHIDVKPIAMKARVREIKDLSRWWER